jgi:MFS family permease
VSPSEHHTADRETSGFRPAGSGSFREDFSRAQIIAIASAILLVALTGIGLGLSIPLLSLEMERMGQPAWLIGLNTAIAGIASLMIIPFVPRLAARYGVGRLIATAICLTALSFLGFRAVFSFWAWFPIRFVFSAGIGTLFVLSEYWIATTAPAARRGLVIGIYSTVLALGFAVGPALLSLTLDVNPWAPYLAGTAVYALAALPLFLARRYLPTLSGAPSHGIATYMWAVPLATATGFAFGAIEAGFFAFLPLYGLAIGLATAQAAFLVSIAALGNVLSQVPIGLLADRMAKPRLILILASIGICGTAVLPLAGATGTFALSALLFVWGGITGGLYTVGLAHLASRYQDSELAGANAAFVMLYNVGLTLGPATIGLGMDLWRPHGFAVAIALFFAAVIAAAMIAPSLARPKAEA